MKFWSKVERLEKMKLWPKMIISHLFCMITEKFRSMDLTIDFFYLFYGTSISTEKMNFDKTV